MSPKRVEKWRFSDKIWLNFALKGSFSVCNTLLRLGILWLITQIFSLQKYYTVFKSLYYCRADTGYISDLSILRVSAVYSDFNSSSDTNDPLIYHFLMFINLFVCRNICVKFIRNC